MQKYGRIGIEAPNRILLQTIYNQFTSFCF